MGLYYVLVADDKGQLTGASLGPFDNRTVVGMRIKKLLANEQLLVDQDGERLTVGTLMQRRSQPGSRTGDNGAPDSVNSIGNFMPTWVVTHVAPPAHLTAAHQLRGLGELRVQLDVLRMVGPVRQGLSSKDERVKIDHARVVNMRVRGDRVDVLLLPNPAHAGSEPGAEPQAGTAAAEQDVASRLKACSIEFLDASAAADFDASLPARVQTVPWPKGPILSRQQLLKTAAIALAVVLAAAAVGFALARRGGP